MKNRTTKKRAYGRKRRTFSRMRGGGAVGCDNIAEKCEWLKAVQHATSKTLVNESDFICGVNAVNPVNIRKEQGKIQTFIDTLSKSSPRDENKLSNAKNLLEQGQEYINCMSPNSANVGAEQTTQDETEARLAAEQKRLAEETEQKRLAEAEAEEQKRLAEEAEQKRLAEAEAEEQKRLADKLAADKLAAAKRQQEAANKAAAAKRQQEVAKENQRLAEQTIQQAKIDIENEQINDNICAKLPDISARPSSGSIISNDYNNNAYDIKDLPKLYNIDFKTFYKVTTDNVTITKIKVTKELFNRIKPLCGGKIKYFYTHNQSAGRRHKKYTKKRR